MKVFIGSIVFSANQAEFMAMVEEKVGPIADMAWITNRHDGNFRGFCFVVFQNEGDDIRAKLTLNNLVYEGRPLICSEASPAGKIPFQAMWTYSC
jgi:RNA recognition motif-containing protein